MRAPIDPKRMLWSSRCFLLAGAFPFVVGSFYYFRFVDDLARGRGTLPVYLSQITYANLMVTGITCMLAGKFGLRPGARWVWWLLLFLIFWAGLNDTYATYSLWSQQFSSFPPLPIIPTVLGGVGLWLSRELA